MSYDFGVYPRDKSYRIPENAPKEEAKLEKTVLYGVDIRNERAPILTMQPSFNYRIAFRNKKGEGFGLDEKLLSKHLLLLGGIGSGKTNVFNFIIESILRKMSYEDVLLIFDTKGDFKNKFYDARNPSHLLIGNDEAYDLISKSLNIFDEMKDSKGHFSKRSEMTAIEISKQLFVGRESPNQPFFTDAATDLVAMVMIDFMRKATRNHMEHALDTYVLVDFLKSATHQMYYNIIMDPNNRDFANKAFYIGKPGEKLTTQALGVFGTINSMVNDLFVGVFAEQRKAGSISMRSLIQEKGRRVLFIEYDLSVGETLGPMYRLMIDLALKAALGGRQEKRGNTYLMIDEFKLLPNLMHIDDALNYGRSMGVKVCAGLQSINQLYDIYGEERGKVLASGFMNSFCFQTWDLDSRKFIRDRFGETFENHALYSNATSPIIFQREGHVVEDWDIMNLDIGEAFVNLNGYKPFRFQFENFEEPHALL